MSGLTRPLTIFN